MENTPECSVFLRVKAQNKILLRSLLNSVLCGSSSRYNAPAVVDTGDAPYLKDASAILAEAGLIVILMHNHAGLKIQLTEEGRSLLTDLGLRSLISRNVQKTMSEIADSTVPPLSTEVPKCAGPFWCQYKDNEPEMEQVYPCEDGLFGVYRSDGELMPIFFDEDVRWSGPIPFPPNYKKEA